MTATVNRQHKSSVFSLLFEEPDVIREVYGALVGKKIPPEVPITFNTLDNALFLGQINDLSFCIGNQLVVLIEHQSSINPNMPLRLLMYIARVYEKIVDKDAIYSSKQMEIPRPLLFVLYNGTDPYDDEKTLKLSDLFIDKSAAPELELTVKVYNINEGHNEKILQNSKTLHGYSMFIEKVRAFEKETNDLGEAVIKAINWCIDNGVLPQFLQLHGSEVRNMLMTEWDNDRYAEVRAKEAEENLRNKVLDLLRSDKSREEIMQTLTQPTGASLGNSAQLRP
jgi:hypothetical protein